MLIWPIGLAVLGAIFGSFIATGAIRWPEGRSPLQGRSACDGCGRTLSAWELVPLASFGVQHGRCRSCGAPIARLHPACEAIGLAIGLAAGFAAPGWTGVGGAIFGWQLLMLGALDLRAFWLPNVATGLLAVTGAIAGLAGPAPPIVDRLIGGAAGFLALWLVAAAYRRLRGRDGLGGGDAKLLGGIGLWLGWRTLPMLVLAACLVGLAAVFVQTLRGRPVKANTQLPLGTMLALAAFPLWIAAAA